VIDLTDIVVAMRKVDAHYEPGEANDLLAEGANEIARLRGKSNRLGLAIMGVLTTLREREIRDLLGLED
jgi:hypothetical protein